MISLVGAIAVAGFVIGFVVALIVIFAPWR
jgi:hypothetical protein